MNGFFRKHEMEAWGGFVYTQGKMFQLIEEDLRRHSRITHAEFEVLLRLSWEKGRRARIQDLAEASLLSPSGTSRLITRLVSAGLVARAGAKEDGRGAYAVLTPEGRRLFTEAARRHVDLVRARFLRHFSRAELAALAKLWNRLSDLGL